MSTVSGADNSSAISSRNTSTDYSTFDTKSLVEAKIAPQTIRIDKLNKEAATNKAKVAAYQDLQTKLQSLNSTLNTLRADPSSSGRSADVFLDRSAYLTMSPSGSADSYLTATVKEGTGLGSHSISVTQVAKTNIVTTAAQTSKTQDLGWSGSFSLGTSGGASATVTITAAMSLADIADTINAQKGTSGVSASVMQVSEGKYQLVLNSIETGKTITASDTAGSTLLSDSSKLGLLDGAGAINGGNVLQAAQKAVFSVDGVTITRSTNDISDVLDGVTLHLYAAPPSGTTLKLEVSNDLGGIKKAVTAFVDAFNAVRDIVLANQKTKSSGTADDSAVLFGDANLRAIASTMQSIVSSNVGNDNLRAIGITMDANNKLVINDATLSNTLLNNLSAVESLFSYKMTASSGDLMLIRHPDSGLDFTLDVTVDGSGKLVSAGIGGDTSLFTVSGNTIRGAAGTPYEGLTLAYGGTTSKSITVKLSQGLADSMYSAIDKSANSNDGALSTLISSLNKNNSDLAERTSALTASTQSYSDYLYTMYGKMAARIAQAQTTLNLLKALLNAGSK